MWKSPGDSRGTHGHRWRTLGAMFRRQHFRGKFKPGREKVRAKIVGGDNATSGNNNVNHPLSRGAPELIKPTPDMRLLYPATNFSGQCRLASSGFDGLSKRQQFRCVFHAAILQLNL